MKNWDDIVREHHALVYRVAFGVLRRQAEAEDVAQDVFLDLLRHPQSLGEADDVRAYVARCAVNRALKSARGGERRARHERAAMREGESMGPTEELFRREIRAKVAELPEEERLAVDLHYLQGLTLTQAAVALQVSDRTVSSRLRSAIDTLKRVLGAAGFAALLLGLETELRAGVVDVPAGLEGRMLRLREGKAGSGDAGSSVRKSRAGSRLAGVALFVAAIVLTIVGVRIWRGTGAGRGAATEGTETASLFPGASTLAPSLNPGTPAVPVLKAASESDPDRALGLTGIVLDHDGNPVARAQLESFFHPLRQGNERINDWGRTFPGPGTMSREDGRFTLPLAPGSLVDVNATATGHASICVPGCPAGAWIEIRLPRPVRLFVHVEDSKGAPVAGALVRLVRRSNVEGNAEEPFVNIEARLPQHDYDRVTTSNGQGLATFDDAPASDTYDVDAAHRDFDYQDTRVDLPAEGEISVTIRFKEGERIAGRVVDDETGNPIQGAILSRHDYLSPKVVTGPDGSFVFEGWLQELSGGPDVFAKGYREASRIDGPPQEMEIRMTRGHGARGRVVGADGRPLAGVLVTAPPETVWSNGTTPVETGEDGLFEVVFPENWVEGASVTCVRPGGGRIRIPITVRDADVDLGDVRFGEVRVLTGTVKGTSGAPFGRSRVVLVPRGDYNNDRYWSSDVLPFQVTVTDDLGRFRIDDVQEGDMTVVVTSPGRSTYMDKFAIRAEGAIPPLNIVLPDLCAILVSVVNDAGAPLEGVGISARGPLDSEAREITDAHGTLTLQMPAGPTSVAGERLAGHMCPQEVRLAEGGGTLTMVYRRGVPFLGRVLMPNGSDPFNGWVRVRVGDNTVDWSGTDIKGDFTVTIPEDGSGTVEIEGRGQGMMSTIPRKVVLEHAVPGRERVTILMPEIKLERQMRAHVVKPDGSAAGAAWIEIGFPGQAHFTTAWADFNGDAIIDGLPEGELEVSSWLSEDDSNLRSEKARVPDGVLEVRLQLEK